jgi:predicted nucleic acid-binding protein
MRCWELRDNLTVCDASYVALAELLGATLVTTDARLSRAPQIMCAVEVLSRAKQ